MCIFNFWRWCRCRTGRQADKKLQPFSLKHTRKVEKSGIFHWFFSHKSRRIKPAAHQKKTWALTFEIASSNKNELRTHCTPDIMKICELQKSIESHTFTRLQRMNVLAEWKPFRLQHKGFFHSLLLSIYRFFSTYHANGLHSITATFHFAPFARPFTAIHVEILAQHTELLHCTLSAPDCCTTAVRSRTLNTLSAIWLWEYMTALGCFTLAAQHYIGKSIASWSIQRELFCSASPSSIFSLCVCVWAYFLCVLWFFPFFCCEYFYTDTTFSQSLVLVYQSTND